MRNIFVRLVALFLLFSGVEVNAAADILSGDSPFWQTFWFRLLLLICIIGGIYLAYYFRIRTLKNKLRRLSEELQKQKDRLKDQVLVMQQARERLQELTTIDELTGIPNRLKFEQHLEQEWKRARRELYPLAIVICDIDHLKAYNDAYGRQHGDQCLVRVARILKNLVRRPGDLAARYGEEEFIVVLSNTNPDQAFYVSEKIRKAIYDLQLPHAEGVKTRVVTASFGVAGAIPREDMNSLALIGCADRALSRAKKEGRNRVVVETCEM